MLPAAALQCLGLIQNHVLPFDPLEVFHILDHQLVARDHHMERGSLCVQCFLFKRRHVRLMKREPKTMGQLTRATLPGSRIYESLCDREDFPSMAAPDREAGRVLTDANIQFHWPNAHSHFHTRLCNVKVQQRPQRKCAWITAPLSAVK